MKREIKIDLLKDLELYKGTGHSPILSIEEIENLINKIYCWYEVKSLELISKNTKINKIANLMTIDELIKRLNDKEQRFLRCEYQASVIRYKNEKPIMKVEILNKSDIYVFFAVEFDSQTGLIYDIDPNDYIDIEDSSKQITLEDLLNLINHDYKYILDTRELEKVIRTRQNNISLRNKVLEIILDMLTTPYLFFENHEFHKVFNLYIEDINEYLNSLSQSILERIKY